MHYYENIHIHSYINTQPTKRTILTKWYLCAERGDFREDYIFSYPYPYRQDLNEYPTSMNVCMKPTSASPYSHFPRISGQRPNKKQYIWSIPTAHFL